jgi:hypothetical protein
MTVGLISVKINIFQHKLGPLRGKALIFLTAFPENNFTGK